MALSPPLLRRCAALLLVAALVPGTWLRERPARLDRSGRITVSALPLPAESGTALGPFVLRGIWHFSSPDFLFGGYSALVARAGGRFVAFSDRGGLLEFGEPAVGQGAASARPLRLARSTFTRADWTGLTDAEAATADPAGHVWVSWEDRRLLSRYAPDLRSMVSAAPPAIRGWSVQFGGESLVRLGDGRFLLTSEAYVPRSYERQHETLVFTGDPVAGRAAPRRGRLAGIPGYRPTDMALLPDGRVLVLERRMLWPLPLRFSCRIGIADPAELDRTGRWRVRELASLDSPLPTDNFEAIAVRPRGDRPNGPVDVWVMSDDNMAATQRTLLLKLELDPRRLPARK